MYKSRIEEFLGKDANKFTKEDIIKFVLENGIKQLNFRYVAADSRLKTLSFVLNSKEHLSNLLTSGERVDGSSLFTYLEAGSSDLYVIPRYKTAFINPFEEVPTLDLLCYYYDYKGERLESSPANILLRAKKELEERTGMTMKVLGELEYYVIAEKEDIYNATDQRSYHESAPFTKHEYIMKEAMGILSEMGANLKYGHSEVGNFSEGDLVMEQYEVEFGIDDIERSADYIIILKWVLRMLGYKYGVTISFAPKITVGKAGSGLHIHALLEKDGKNMLVDEGKLNDTAKKMIAGILDLSPSLTAFGNTIPTSYLRLVPHQEAPTNICWGDRNRSVLVRVPLGWLGNTMKMTKDANNIEEMEEIDFSNRQTVEFRCPDGSANIYLLLAGLAVATLHGLEMDNALNLAEQTYVNVNIFQEQNKHILEKLNTLPDSCYLSGEQLLNQMEYYTKYNVFSKNTVKSIADELKAFKDKNMSEELYGKNDEIRKLIEKYIHCA